MISLLCFYLISTVHSAIHEPPDGKVYFGAWLDTADSAPKALDGDRPMKWNQRIGFNSSLFHYGEDLPIPPNSFSFPYDQVFGTETDAMILLTVYPQPNPWTISDADIQALADRLQFLNNAGRRVLVRLAPEMNGNWFKWGQQPTNYILMWKKIVTLVRNVAPLTGFVWAPNSGNGYPFPNPAYPFAPTPQDFTLLDTNKDGVVNANDDAFSPYYPGDEYVDWIGMSIYTYGTSYPWSDNIIAPPGKFETILNDHNFYNVYALEKNKPFMVSETGASFHLTTPLPGVSEVLTKQSWWQQFLTNQTFLSKYPKIKSICQFEFKKYEEFLLNGQPDLRDFRISFNPDVLAAFKTDFASVKSFYIESQWNTAKPPPLPPSSGPSGVISTPSANVPPSSRTKNDSHKLSWSFLLSLSSVILLILI